MVQCIPPPSIEDINDTVMGKQRLPWNSQGFDNTRAEGRALADDYRTRFFEWQRSKEEQEIAQREIKDALRCYQEHLGIINSAFEQLPTSSPTPFTPAEGSRFFLSHWAKSVVSVHRRMLNTASAVGLSASMCTPVDEQLAEKLCGANENESEPPYAGDEENDACEDGTGDFEEGRRGEGDSGGEEDGEEE